MKLSKMGKKIISVTMAAAFVLTSFAVPWVKNAKAADLEPTVKLLGATLRVEGNESGTQSVRVGIRVDNAQNASECGIIVTNKANGKTITVSTENGNKNMYLIDTTENYVVYTVVIKDIPVNTDYADMEFTFQGIAKPIEDANPVYSDISSGKSLNNVLASIAEKSNQTLKFDTDGSILSLVKSLNMDAREDFKNESGCFVAGRDNEFVDYCTYDEINKCYVIDYTDEALNEKFSDGGFKGIGFKSPSKGEYIYRITVKADDTTYIRLIPHWNGFTGDCSKAGTIVAENEWQTKDMKIDSDGGTYCFGTGDNSTVWQGEKGCAGKYYIGALDVYKVFTDADVPEVAVPAAGWNADHTEYSIKLDENTVKPNGKCSAVKNDNGSYTIASAAGEGYEIGFSFPEEIWSEYDFRQMKIKYRNASGFTGGRVNKYGQLSPWWNAGEDNGNDGNIPDGSGEKIFSVKDEKVVDGKYFSAFRIYSVPAAATVTIESITLTGLTEHAPVTPTPEPTQRPEPPAADEPEGEGWTQIDLSGISAKSDASTGSFTDSGSLVLKGANYIEVPLGKDYTSTELVEVYITGVSYDEQQETRIWLGGRDNERITEVIKIYPGGGNAFNEKLTFTPKSDGPEKDTYNEITIVEDGKKLRDLEITSIWFREASQTDVNS